MYKIATRSNTAWGIDGYQVPSHYFDPITHKEKKDIEELLSKNKTIPANNKYITKKGSFLLDEQKLTNKEVGPGKYIITDVWAKTAEESKKRIKFKPGNRDTFIDNIYKEQKLRSTPGPNVY